MKIGDRVVIRASAQTWKGLVEGACHYYPVLTNTENGWSEVFEIYGDEDEAKVLTVAVAQFFQMFDHKRYVLLVGVSSSEMALPWE